MNSDLKLKILDLYEIIEDIDIVKTVNEGYLSNNSILQNSKGGSFFLKQYAKAHTLRGIRDIHKVKFYFSKSGIPIILPYRNKRNETIFEYKNRHYALFPFVEGRIVEGSEFTDKEIIAMGKLLGNIHILSSKGVLFSLDKIKNPWNYERFQKTEKLVVEKIKDVDEKNDFDKLTLKVLKKKKQIIEGNKVLYENLNVKNDHLLHGDFHEKNIFFDKNGNIKYIFDLEKTCIGPRAFELVRAIDFIFFDGRYEEENINRAKLSLQVYKEIYPIRREEFENILEFYFIKKAHSVWVETEHYIKGSNRIDIFLRRELLMLEYYSKNRKDLVERLFKD